MENVIKFSDFNEGVDYHTETKEERHVKSKEWFIKKISAMGGEDKDKLSKMGLEELGRLYAKKKKK